MKQDMLNRSPMTKQLDETVYSKTSIHYYLSILKKKLVNRYYSSGIYDNGEPLKTFVQQIKT